MRVPPPLIRGGELALHGLLDTAQNFGSVHVVNLILKTKGCRNVLGKIVPAGHNDSTDDGEGESVVSDSRVPRGTERMNDCSQKRKLVRRLVTKKITVTFSFPFNTHNLKIICSSVVKVLRV